MDVGRPVETLAVLRVHEGLVATRGHHYNAIVCHFYLIVFNFVMFDLRNRENRKLS